MDYSSQKLYMGKDEGDDFKLGKNYSAYNLSLEKSNKHRKTFFDKDY